MRLWQMAFAIATLAVVMTIARDPIGRTFVIVFTTGLGEVVLGLTAIMALFQTVGAIGEAKRLSDHVEAIAATTAVLTVGSALMSAWLFVGAWLVTALV